MTGLQYLAVLVIIVCVATFAYDQGKHVGYREGLRAAKQAVRDAFGEKPA